VTSLATRSHYDDGVCLEDFQSLREHVEVVRRLTHAYGAAVSSSRGVAALEAVILSLYHDDELEGMGIVIGWKCTVDAFQQVSVIVI